MHRHYLHLPVPVSSTHYFAQAELTFSKAQAQPSEAGGVTIKSSEPAPTSALCQRVGYEYEYGVDRFTLTRKRAPPMWIYFYIFQPA